jgi:hypothetical protein
MSLNLARSYLSFCGNTYNANRSQITVASTSRPKPEPIFCYAKQHATTSRTTSEVNRECKTMCNTAALAYQQRNNAESLANASHQERQANAKHLDQIAILCDDAIGIGVRVVVGVTKVEAVREGLVGVIQTSVCEFRCARCRPNIERASPIDIHRNDGALMYGTRISKKPEQATE